MAAVAVQLPQSYVPYDGIQKYEYENQLLEAVTEIGCQPNGAAAGKELVRQAMLEHIQAVDGNTCEPGDEDPFYVADMGEVYRQYVRWKLNLGRVKPHYAVKCNPDREVLRLLAALGTGFDCASKAEIDAVLELRVDPSRIIYAQPCKTKSYIRHAAHNGVSQMTFDNADELHKVAALYPEAELYLRILTDDSSSLCRLSQKFGAALEDCPSLLRTARTLGLNIAGVSFHVGSGASDPDCFRKAVRDAREVFNMAELEGLAPLHTLDIGGGFTGELFEEMAAVIRQALDDYFPQSVRIIGEPGRFFVADAYTLACHVTSRRALRDPATGEEEYMVYLNDGVYGNFSCIMFDHQAPEGKILTAADTGAAVAGRAISYSLWGPTCDGIDRISERVVFDRMLGAGDWLYFENMGAYTRCSATKFNGFADQHEVVYVASEEAARTILQY